MFFQVVHTIVAELKQLMDKLHNDRVCLCFSDANYSVFFFSSRRRHTSLTCDWSSDVCSSDLLVQQVDPHGAADAVADHHPLHVVDRLDRVAVDGDDEVLRTEAGGGSRGARHHLDHLDPGGATELTRDDRRQRPRAARQAEVRAPEAALAHQGADDAARAVVDRHGESEPDAGDGRVDADDARPAVRERAARVAGVQRRVRLDDVVDDPPGPVGSERPSAETTPAVTEPANPCGFPIATTSWPTRSDVASPSSAACSAPASARSTARSESGSAPTTSA